MSSIRPRGKSWKRSLNSISRTVFPSSACHREKAYLVDTTWSDVRGVHSGSGHALVEFKHLKEIESRGNMGGELKSDII